MKGRHALALTLTYAAANLISVALVMPSVFIGPIRLSAGVVMTALLLVPPSQWWMVLLALVPYHAWVGDPTNYYTVALQYFAANASEALVAAAIIRRLIGAPPRLATLKTCLVFLAAAIIVGPLVGATIGAPVIWRRQLTVSPLGTWEVWALADAVGNLVIVPLGLAIAAIAAEPPERARWSIDRRRVAEAVAVGAAILLTTAPAVGPAALGFDQAPVSMLYLPFPMLVWASLRFGPPGAALAILTLNTVTILRALGARGLFGQPWNADSVVAVQQFLVVSSATAVTLAALAAERWRAEDAALEEQERLRLALQVAKVGAWSWNLKTDTWHVSEQAATVFGTSVAVLERGLPAILEHIHPDDRARVMADAAATQSAGGAIKVAGDYRVIRPDGATIWIRSYGSTLVDAAGVPARAVGILMDITDRMAQDLERDATTRALVALSRSPVANRGQIDEALEEITWTAAETLGVERASVWLFSDNDTHLRCVNVYERTPKRHSSGTDLAVDQYPAYFKAVRDERTLAVEDTSVDPTTRELAPMHRTAGITSMLDAPIRLGGRLGGVFSFQHVGPPRQWSPEARTFAGSIADVLSNAFEAVERRKAELRLQHAYAQLRTLARRLEAAKEEERRSIARELHDELGQSLTAIVLALNLVARNDREGRHADPVARTVALAERLIERVRAISLNLRPPLLDELGLMRAVRGYLERHAEEYGLAIDVDLPVDGNRLPNEIEIGAFRIVQECLTNVVRHAGAERVAVRLAPQDQHLLIEVADDGRGFDVPAVLERAVQGHHLGLLGLQERVTVLGGQVQFESHPGGGTRVSARLPLNVVF